VLAANMARIGRVAIKAIIYFEVMTTIALIIGTIGSQPLFREVEGDNGFGNGRGVRNLFEATLVRHANRIAPMHSPSDRDLSLLLADHVN
jgi:hypothetical protein